MADLPEEAPATRQRRHSNKLNLIDSHERPTAADAPGCRALVWLFVVGVLPGFVWGVVGTPGPNRARIPWPAVSLVVSGLLLFAGMASFFATYYELREIYLGQTDRLALDNRSVLLGAAGLTVAIRCNAVAVARAADLGISSQGHCALTAILLSGWATLIAACFGFLGAPRDWLVSVYLIFILFALSACLTIYLRRSRG